MPEYTTTLSPVSSKSCKLNGAYTKAKAASQVAPILKDNQCPTIKMWFAWPCTGMCERHRLIQPIQH